MKKCTKCNETKELEEFHRDKTKEDGRTSNCKTCRADSKRAYYQANKKVILAQTSAYYQANKNNKVNKGNLESRRIASKAYYQANKDKRAAYLRNRYQTDPVYRITMLCRHRLRQVLKGESKSASTIELLGCTPEHFKLHIESQFTDGMTWENQGEWHIDHIQPCASFNLEDEDEQRKCFHYTNMQPLWASDNLRKSDRIVPEHQVNLI